MAGMGPAPKPASQRRRQNKTNAVVRLPREGRPGPAPRWPLLAPTVGEAALWEELWATPQAVAWETFGWTRVVARYVSCVLRAEATLHPQVMGEARQLEDRLGLSPMAMLRLRWEMTDDQSESDVPSTVTALADYRAMVAGDEE